MAEKPIRFTGNEVSAILDGRKTMTRRIMKPQPVDGWWHHPKKGTFGCESGDRPSIYGAYVPGDTLWVRETFAFSTGPREGIDPDIPELYAVVYREEWDRLRPNCPLDGVWKPSIHMPRWASRISLRVTDVTVERLQEITANPWVWVYTFERIER
jgi:hypothetical protein